MRRDTRWKNIDVKREKDEMYDVEMGLHGFWKESMGCIIVIIERLLWRPACSRLGEPNE